MEVLLLTFHSLGCQGSFPVMETQLMQDCGDTGGEKGRAKARRKAVLRYVSSAWGQSV